MAKKSGGSRLIGTLVTAGAVFVARKLLTVVWTRATGKTPPTDPTDTTVSVGEALTWAVVAGITVETTKLFAARAAARHAGDTAGASDVAISAPEEI
jgi:Protein of unknown function (DUF4235)